MESRPKLSVLLPAYNAERFVGRAVESILAQTFGNFELLIVEDGSSDGTFGILDRLKDPRIILGRNGKNIGLIASLNHALSLARGELIARMDADDIALPDRFERQVRFLEKNSDVGIVGGQMSLMNEMERPTGKYEVPLEHGSILWNLLTGRWALAHPSIMARKSLFDVRGFYNPDYPHVEDLEMWMRFAPHTRFANLAGEVLRYRETPGSICREKHVEQRSRYLELASGFASSLIGRAVEPDEMELVFNAQNGTAALTQSQAETVMRLLGDLAAGLGRQPWFDPSRDAERIHDELLAAQKRVVDGPQENAFSPPAPVSFRLRNLIPASAKLRIRSILKEIKPLPFPYDATAGKDRPAVLDEPSESRFPNLPGFSELVEEKAGYRAEARQAGVSVLVLSYARPKALAVLIEGLLAQNLNGLPMELIIWNNFDRLHLAKNSWSRLGRLLKKFPDIKIINSSENWYCRAQYTAATLAKYETILFLDDDITLLSRHFVRDFYDTFRPLGEKAILSCWNSVWTRCLDDHLEYASVTFVNPEPEQVVETDTAGSGICMFRKSLIDKNQLLWQACDLLPADVGMSFPPLASIACDARTYYFPAHGMLEFHPELIKHALHRRENHQRILHAIYRWTWQSGYRPVLERDELKGTEERKRLESLIRKLPIRSEPW